MKFQSLLLLTAFILPNAAIAQGIPTSDNGQSQTRSDDAKPANANDEKSQTNSNNAQPQQAPTPGRRFTRTIENREFSNKDKILLLLSAHCDFPTKEDLISSVNPDMLLKEKNAEKATQNEPNAENAQSASNKAQSGVSSVSTTDIENYLQDTLYSILSDESQLFTIRRRALEALAYFDTPKNERMLEYIVTHPEQIKRPLMLVQAIRSFPQIAPKKAAHALARYLDSPNDMIRFVTISTLKNTPGKEAVEVLRERLSIEKNLFFQKRLQEAIDGHCKKDVYCQ